MLLKNLINILFVLIPLVISTFCFTYGLDYLKILEFFLVSIIVWYFFIYPIINNKNLYVEGYTYEADNKIFNIVVRIVFFILGLCGYFMLIYRIIIELLRVINQ